MTPPRVSSCFSFLLPFSFFLSDPSGVCLIRDTYQIHSSFVRMTYPYLSCSIETMKNAVSRKKVRLTIAASQLEAMYRLHFSNACQHLPTVNHQITPICKQFGRITCFYDSLQNSTTFPQKEENALTSVFFLCNQQIEKLYEDMDI